MPDSALTTINKFLDTISFPIQTYFVLDGNKSPGVCTIRGAGTPRKWTKHEGFGTSGAWLTFMGNGLTEFEIDIYLFDEKLHPPAWEQFAACLVKAQAGKPAVALQIEHPILVHKPLDITKVVVTDVSQPEQDDFGGFTITIKFLEYAPPKSVKVQTADTPDVPNTPPKPADAGEQHIAVLTAQRDRLANAP